MTEIIQLALCLLVGVVLGFFAARLFVFGGDLGLRATITELRAQVTQLREEATQARAQASALGEARAMAHAELAEARRQLDAKSDAANRATDGLRDAFKSLAADALRENRDGFLALAQERLRAIADSAHSETEQGRTAVSDLVASVKDALAAFARETRVLEERRLEEFGAIGQQYRDVATATTELHRETSRLVTALRTPHVRGRWGQITLRRAAELAGMVSHTDFTEEKSVEGDDGMLRPDMIVHFPNRRHLVIDAKVPMQAYLDAQQAESEQDRASALARHARQLRDHVGKLASKDYQRQLDRSPEFVVLFVPNDSFLSAASQVDQQIVDDALVSGVVLATPATLFALLKAIAYGWRQQEIADSAESISRLGRQLADRLSTVAEHLDQVGGGLRRAVDAYNAAVGSFEARLLPTARRFRQLGILGRRPVPQLNSVDVIPRALIARPAVEGAQELFADDDHIESVDGEEDGPDPTSPPPGPAHNATSSVERPV